jgi:hypothetical protein
MECVQRSTFIDLGCGIGAGIISGHKMLRAGSACWLSWNGVSSVSRDPQKDLLATLDANGLPKTSWELNPDACIHAGKRFDA